MGSLNVARDSLVGFLLGPRTLHGPAPDSQTRCLGQEVLLRVGGFSTNSGTGTLSLTQTTDCPWDLDDNAVVGVSDLLSLLGSWGPCKDCPADFDGNVNVGVSDLLTLLGNWGPCP